MLENPRSHQENPEQSTKTELVQKLIIKSGLAARKAGKLIATKSLESLAADPEISPGLMGRLLEILPFVSASKTYAQAWKSYHRAIAEADPDNIEKAQIKTLVALEEAGLDIVLYFAMRYKRAAAFLLKAGGWASSLKLGPLEKLKTAATGQVAAKLIKKPLVERFVVVVLNAIEPAAKQTGAEQKSQLKDTGRV